ncbi:MAG: glycosyltransferase [Candidatus Azobacteroides sp.]|nr:glycosyltransferase [Candidatus Azobacteroides sp.]
MENYNMKLAPIALFTYNRPQHTKETIEALLLNEFADESDLIIFSDAAKNDNATKGVNDTRQYLKTITGFKSVQIIERETNYGLANSIIDGVSDVVGRYGQIIVLEDDLLTSPYFLRFMNEAMNLYENQEDVISIHGYLYPVNKKMPETFFIRGADCWGWGTWRRGWDIFNVNGQELLDELIAKKLEWNFDYNGSYPYTKMLKKQVKGAVGSWAIRWYASAFMNNKLTLYPGRSLVFNSGNEGSGTNCGESDEFNTELSATPITLSKIEIKESKEARDAFIHYFRYTRLKKKIVSRLKKLFAWR